MPTENYKEFLIQDLKNPESAAAYLNACLEESPDIFLLALKDVAEAWGGMTYLSGQSRLNREHLYRIFSQNGNPRLSSLQSILHTCGLQLSIRPRLEASS